MLHQRLITGAVLIAGLLALLWFDARFECYQSCFTEDLPWWTGGANGLVLAAAAIVLLAPVAGAELARMLRGMGVAAPTWLTMLAAVLGVVAMRLAAKAPSAAASAGILGSAVWLVVCLALVVHARHRRVEGVAAASAGTLLSFAYIGVMLGVWLLVRREVDAWVVAGAILTIKSSDSGAYFTGMSIGRHKLIPWLSPGKTWEGLAGGVVGAAAVGAALAWWSTALPAESSHVPVWLGAVGGAVLGLIAPFGDLAESLFKRSAGVKDSGKALPGMGGALDVFDSVLLAGPAVLGLLLLRGIGG